MSKFIHKITLYHFNSDKSVARIEYNEVYFRHNKKSNLVDKRA